VMQKAWLEAKNKVVGSQMQLVVLVASKAACVEQLLRRIEASKPQPLCRREKILFCDRFVAIGLS